MLNFKVSCDEIKQNKKPTRCGWDVTNNVLGRCKRMRQVRSPRMFYTCIVWRAKVSRHAKWDPLEKSRRMSPFVL